MRTFYHASFVLRNAYGTIVLFFTLNFCHAQLDELKIDSLKHLLKETTTDTITVKALAEIGHEYISIKPDSALHFLNEAYAFSKKVNFKRGEAIALNYIGRHYTAQHQYYVAMDFFLKSLKVTDYQDQRLLAITYFDLGKLYSSMAPIFGSSEISQKSIFYYRKALQALNTVHNNELDYIYMRAGIYTEIGRSQMSNHLVKEGELDSAENNFKSSLDLFQKIGSTIFEITSTSDLSHLYFIKKDYKEAIRYAKKSIQLEESSNIYHLRSVLYSNIARYYSVSSQFDSAQHYINKAFASATDIEKNQCYQVQAEIFRHKQEYKKAVKYYELLMNDAIKNRDGFTLSLAYFNLYDCYKHLNDYRSAIVYNDLNNNLRDSILNQDTDAKMTELQSQFDAKLDQDQIDLLSKETELKNTTIQRNKLILVTVISLLFLALLTVSHVIYRNRMIRRAKLQQELAYKKMDKLKSRFFANISHEFRTPLTLILTPLQKKIAQAASPDEKQEFTLMHRSASRLLTLVNQLLDLTRLEAGTLTLDLRYANLKKFLLPITSQFASISNSKNVSFSVNMADNIELFIDHDKTEKIITNLLFNAFKFTPAQGAVTLLVTKEEPTSAFPNGYAAIRVQDNGAGIAPEHLTKVFDRFYQADNSSWQEGTGIGLALCKELVELHKGTITVQSETRKGSVFTVCLPLSNLQSESHAVDDTIESDTLNTLSAQVEPKENSALQTAALEESILIIEDNDDLRQYLKQELNNSFHILEAVDGEKGLILAFEKMPDAIISDLMMPGRDGLQLCEIIKNDTRTSHIPILLLTARADIETRLKGLSFGADDYIAKPFVMEEVRLRVFNMIESRNHLRKKYSQQIQLRPSEIKAASADERFLKNVMEVTEAHLGDVSFGVEVFAQKVGMSQAQLYRKLHALTEYTPNEFIRHMRLLRAKELLRQKVGNVAEVAYQVGFNNLSYFAKCFKTKFAVSPSDFLKNPLP